MLQKAGAIQTEAILQDSTVLESDIVYPTDIHLVYKALKKIQQFAKKKKYPLWWDHKVAKSLWRSYNLEKKADSDFYLQEFTKIFASALEKLRELILLPQEEETENLSKDQQLLELLILFQEQNQMKLEGVRIIPNRIVSFDDSDARPIKSGSPPEGKKHPSCEFGWARLGQQNNSVLIDKGS